MKVLIADGSALIRDRLADSLTADNEIEIIGHANNAIETVAALWKFNPDAVVMDTQLPAGSGIEVLQSIKKHKPSTHVIVLTSSNDPIYREKCIAMGAHAFLDKATEFYVAADILKELHP